MASSKAILAAFVVGACCSAASAKNIRGFESDVARKLASSGSKCWIWCTHGSCSWSWRGCQCICEHNWKGACCNDMIVCGPEKDACPQDMLTRKTVGVSSLLGSDNKFRSDIGPRVQRQGPEALRGLFWLTDQKDSSSLVSFARSNDGGNMGQGELRQGRYAFSVRVGGDRSWSFADNVFGGNFETVELLDLVYHFKVKSGSLQNPTAFSIIPEARNLGAKLEGKFGEWLLGFDMVKLASENATAAGYSGSIVWDRISSAFGQDIDSARYLAVQVVDGDSNPIQPAYDQWVAYMAGAAAGSSPGQIHYREALTTDGSL